MPLARRILILAGTLLALPLALRSQIQSTDAPGATIVTSATKTRADAVDVPASVSVVSGDELRRHGAKTVAEALQDVMGIDTGNGSDDGSPGAVIGVRGIRDLSRDPHGLGQGLARRLAGRGQARARDVRAGRCV